MDENLRVFTTLLGGTLVSGDPARRIRGVASKPENGRVDIAVIIKRPYALATLRALAGRGVPVVATTATIRRLGPGQIIAVDHPVQAHKHLIRAYRDLLGVPLVAITGTAGKTTTKNMLRLILQRHMRVTASRESFNATPRYLIIRANHDTQVFVVEMGMRGCGQIAAQCRLAGPTVGVITNIGRGHVGHCGDFAGVIRAKGELVRGLSPDGTLILNADDSGTAMLDLGGFKGKVIRFGRAATAQFRLEAIRTVPGGQIFTVHAEGMTREFRLRLLGSHQVYNALAAMAAARAVGATWEDIRVGLETHAGSTGRLAPRRGIRGCLVLDDSFNANPLSVRAGLETMRTISAGRSTVAVLGNMEDQGSGWPAVHRDIGALAVRLGIDRLVTVGDKARQIALGAIAAGMPAARLRAFSDRRSALRYLLRTVTPSDIVLIKGSHGTHMKSLAQYLQRP